MFEVYSFKAPQMVCELRARRGFYAQRWSTHRPGRRTNKIFCDNIRSQQVLSEERHRPNMPACSAIQFLSTEEELMCLWLTNIKEQRKRRWSVHRTIYAIWHFVSVFSKCSVIEIIVQVCLFSQSTFELVHLKLKSLCSCSGCVVSKIRGCPTTRHDDLVKHLTQKARWRHIWSMYPRAGVTVLSIHKA